MTAYLKWDLEQITTPAHGLDADWLKRSLNYTSTSQDDLITSLIDASFDAIEGRLNSPILETQFRARHSYALGRAYDRLALPKLPVASVDEVKVSLDDVDTVLQSADYDVVLGGNAYVGLRDEWYEAVTITFTAGHSEIPAPVKTAVALHASDLFRNRNANLDSKYVPTAINTLISSYIKPPYYARP